MRRIRDVLDVLMVVCAVGVGACSHAAPTAVMPTTVSRDWVTGAAAEALGPDGRFILPGPRSPGPLEISEANARAQAVGWARMIAQITPAGGIQTFAPGNGLEFAPGGSGLERDYGGKIPFAQLRDCGRSLYAESGYAPVPVDAPRFVLNGFGAYWIVRLCAPAGEIPVVLAVSTTSEFVVLDGRLQPSPSARAMGNEFRSVAIPRGTPEYPLEPEAAVAVAFRTTGRRVSEIPVFVQRVADYGRPEPFYPQNGRWHITLESPVHGVGAPSGTEYVTRDVMVSWPEGTGPDTTLLVALAAQPDTALHVPYKHSGQSPSGAAREDTVRVAVRKPYRFEVLRVVRE